MELSGAAAIFLSAHIGRMRHLDPAFALRGASEAFRVVTAADALDLIGHGLAEARFEILRLAHLSRAGEVILIEDQPGGQSMLKIAPGQILRRACLLGTQRLLIAHNHPSGDPVPSQADRVATRELAELLRAADIALVDHMIFARDGVTSFRALGLL